MNGDDFMATSSWRLVKEAVYSFTIGEARGHIYRRHQPLTTTTAPWFDEEVLCGAFNGSTFYSTKKSVEIFMGLIKAVINSTEKPP